MVVVAEIVGDAAQVCEIHRVSHALNALIGVVFSRLTDAGCLKSASGLVCSLKADLEDSVVDLVEEVVARLLGAIRENLLVSELGPPRLIVVSYT